MGVKTRASHGSSSSAPRVPRQSPKAFWPKMVAVEGRTDSRVDSTFVRAARRRAEQEKMIARRSQVLIISPLTAWTISNAAPKSTWAASPGAKSKIIAAAGGSALWIDSSLHSAE